MTLEFAIQSGTGGGVHRRGRVWSIANPVTLRWRRSGTATLSGSRLGRAYTERPPRPPRPPRLPRSALRPTAAVLIRATQRALPLPERLLSPDQHGTRDLACLICPAQLQLGTVSSLLIRGRVWASWPWRVDWSEQRPPAFWPPHSDADSSSLTSAHHAANAAWARTPFRRARCA